MFFITLQSLPAFLNFSQPGLVPRLKPRQVPLAQWALQVLVLTGGSLLNNWAFAYNVPLTVVIVFRSAGETQISWWWDYVFICFSGLPVSMLFGYIFSRRQYTPMQIVSGPLCNPCTVIFNISLSVLCCHCYCRSHYGHALEDKPWGQLTNIKGQWHRRSAEIFLGHRHVDRLPALHWAIGASSRTNISEVWTLLERRCLLYRRCP